MVNAKKVMHALASQSGGLVPIRIGGKSGSESGTDKALEEKKALGFSVECQRRHEIPRIAHDRMGDLG